MRNLAGCGAQSGIRCCYSGYSGCRCYLAVGLFKATDASVEEVLHERHLVGQLHRRHGQVLLRAVLRVDRLLSVVGGALLHLVHRIHAALSNVNRLRVAELAFLVLAEVHSGQLLELVQTHHIGERVGV